MRETAVPFVKQFPFSSPLKLLDLINYAYECHLYGKFASKINRRCTLHLSEPIEMTHEGEALGSMWFAFWIDLLRI